ncbi:hypothetical protein bsdtw1_04798 [Clostridium fungisolvens]|uniref:Uncharacterized protein n=1 Tax=Clostridium fungisolvens TaxID=1604897 RepID=A0A6V8SP28_9CLOT|nr:hypothetical protein bsdtw1_04798 [Clostridium fungisolvens]
MTEYEQKSLELLQNIDTHIVFTYHCIFFIILMVIVIVSYNLMYKFLSYFRG